ncbi:hypothetical protein ACFPVY_14050 [Flavobacterium qiangtangense]|uniref:Uncharacterized protein n=1 Tax=Flavobacterium qiangtangense TaxID=1442595 RepID=A0ABW1PSA6_9FLAO
MQKFTFERTVDLTNANKLEFSIIMNLIVSYKNLHPQVRSLAPIVAEILSWENLFFPGSKERLEEAPFLALEKKIFPRKIEAESRNSF